MKTFRRAAIAAVAFVFILLAGSAVAQQPKLNPALQQAQSTPMEMQFTAVDGRQVDLAKLRGKVVLIDFWASTWCTVCRREIPHMKALYEKYRDQGFEIVGITMEMNPTDKAVLQKFIADKGVAWPQYFDGKGVTGNPFAKKYGITSAPFGLMLDKQGLLVSTEAVGKNLEPLIRKHLGLPEEPAPAGK